ncbi:NYN domain-containing protein [Selenomonas timonae]|uniref:NYN domain-containing protein n=1 Tax=Selenomonas timonae TaxID=2754044 RepID=A0A7G7VHN0_9FIRM|nr:NYN domain-containing protein [Selenomonas timonae]QNH53623.1 NYN domain-containing protein [Selenomonas timonae]
MARQRESEYYLIDGYNVINAWPELIRLRGNLDEARDVLVHILTEYGAFENYEMTVVFDAFFTEDDEHELQITDRMKVIYTGAGETADSCIERLAYTAVRAGREVHVVTSDGAEQSVILGAGAYRITSPELRRSVKKSKKQMKAEYIGAHTQSLGRIEVHERLDRDTLARLEEMRRKK